jgi:aspartate kinase
MKVMKFGGSTIRTPDMVEKVIDLIKSDDEKKVIVISALHGQTNEIREYISRIRTERKEIDSFIKKITDRHIEFAKKTVTKKEILKDVLENLNNQLLKLERLLYGIAYTEELTPRTTDLILSSAERMSAIILEGILLSHDISARAFEADKIGIMTDGVFCNASADLKTTEKNLKRHILPEIDNGVITVITGFFGCDSEGRTCTFGKNGSDYSAAVIAHALNASVLELWKDVDGFLSADPEIVENAYTIDKLSYDEAAELAHFGIDVLHPRTVEPVRAKIIPIQIKNIHRPHAKGTEIGQNGYSAKEIIKSIVYSTDLAEVKVSSAGAGHRPGVLAMVTKILNDANINIYSVTTSQTQLSLLTHKSDLQKCLKILEALSNGNIKAQSSQQNIALICVVGEGATESVGLAGKIFNAIANAKVNIKIISAGASQVAAHFIIQKNHLEKSIKAIHETFCANSI